MVELPHDAVGGVVLHDVVAFVEDQQVDVMNLHRQHMTQVGAKAPSPIYGDRV